MANPNILNITSVTLSSNSLRLPSSNSSAPGAEQSSVTNSTDTAFTFGWPTQSSRLVLTNPVGSNQVFKITSLKAQGGFQNVVSPGTPSTGVSYSAGLTVFTTSAGLTGSSNSVINFLYGGTRCNTNGVLYWGPPNIGPTRSTSIPIPTDTLVIDSSSPYYLTEGFSLHAVTRGVYEIAGDDTYYFPSVLTYSYETIQ